MSAASSLDWDYGDVAEAYAKRPGYAPATVAAIVRHADLGPGATVCDVGAGTGNLTAPLARHGLRVIAVEPSLAMQRIGRARTAHERAVSWRTAVAEATGLPAASCDAVGFGSSFNVVRTAAAVRESARILRRGGWLFCLWNHRVLDDPLQAEIEHLIRRHVPGFAHGARRADPTPALLASAAFGGVEALAAPVRHAVPRDDFAAAWRSHLTLRRQAGGAFADVLAAIDRLLAERAPPVLEVPYVTRAWLARKGAR